MATTNILQITGFSQIPYRIFILPPTNSKSASNTTNITNDLRRTQVSLLRRGELANEKNGELWTFSRDGLQSAPTPDESSGLQETSTGTLFASQLLPPNESPPQNAITQSLRNGAAHGNFLCAVRNLAEFNFLHLYGYSVLGGWLVTPPEVDTGSEEFRALLPALRSPKSGRDLFKLNINLAANGDLYISPERNAHISVQELDLSQLPAEGTTIFLSPSGKQAEFLSVLPSISQTSPMLQKIRASISLKATFPFARIRLAGGPETLWPLNLCFQRYPSYDSAINGLDYFTFKDGMSSATKLVSDALTYKPPPAPSPAIPPAVAAHVTPSGVYHTPPDGATRTKQTTAQEPTPAITQTTQDEWSAPVQDGYWPPVNESRDDDDFGFGGMDDGFELGDEDFKFFDDGPTGDFETEELNMAEVTVPQEQVPSTVEEIAQPMEDVKLEKPPSPPATLEEAQVLSPPYSPLRILPSPPPTRRGTIPRIWDHVRLSGDLDKIRDKYSRGGKYWCEDLEENALTDDTMSTSGSDDEDRDRMTPNPRKRKRDDEDEDLGHKLGNGYPGTQSLDSDLIFSMLRIAEEQLLMANSAQDDLFAQSGKTDRKSDYASEMDLKTFMSLVDIVANQVSWDALEISEPARKQQELPLSDLKSVISNIWGDDAPSNPCLKEWTEANDQLPTSEEEDSPQMKTPKMRARKSSISQNNSYSLVNNIEQTQSLYPINSPSFLVHRIISRNPPAPNHMQRLSVLPPALRFWEKFAFTPVSGEKHVRCYVVHLESEGMSTAVDSFLSELQVAWEGCGMGKFERGKVKDGRDGMLAVNIPYTLEEESCTAAYHEALVNLGRGMSSVSDKWLQNIMILMVNPFASRSVIVPFCRSFLSFKSAYIEGADNPALIPESNLALQIIPASMIAQKEGIITRGLEFQALIRTLYDRCGVMEHLQTENPKPAARPIKFLTSPATLLAPPPPSHLDFTDTFPTHHRNLLKDNSSMHLAYSMSHDYRWVTAVWSDDWGQVSFRESYYLSHLKSPPGGANHQKNGFDKAAARMWLRTADILKQPKISWRLNIVRVGAMSKFEYSCWKALKESNEKWLPGRLQLVLACFDLHPALEVYLSSNGNAAASPLATISTPFPSSMAVFSQSSPAALGNAYGTPVATPLAQTNESPDPSGGLMSTPGGTVNVDTSNEFDPDARWIDARDEVWAIVLNHRVPAYGETDSETEFRFAAASGFLWPVKSTASDNLVQVHLLHADKPPSVEAVPTSFSRDILKNLLGQYRSLASLGNIRGVSMGEKPVPWHVVAAERVNDLLTEYM